MIFKLDEEEEEKANNWIKSQLKKDKSNFTTGERWTYSFTPTGLGILIILKDNILKEEITLTNFEYWG